MLRYIVKRLVYVCFVLAMVSAILFGIFKLVPGDPAAIMTEGQRMSLEPAEYQELYQKTREQLGLDDPLVVQYFSWVGMMLQGDLGYSIIHKKPVLDVIGVPMSNTIKLNLLTMILTFAITIPLGITTAVKKYSAYDNTVQVLSVVGYSIPSFIVGLVFICIFSVILGIFPISGTMTAGTTAEGWDLTVDKLRHMALPVIVMTFGSLGGITRYVRGAMIEALQMDYIRTARAKGLKEKVVIYVHAFRNSMVPLVTITTSWMVGLFGGSVIIESIFSWGGMGNLLVTSLRQQDYSVAMALQIFFVLLVLLGNVIMDIGYCLVDPRVKFE
ncbi:MAG: ABC transporter permease [Eubacteriales bacterium]